MQFIIIFLNDGLKFVVLKLKKLHISVV